MKEVDQKELLERVELNYNRLLNDPFYFAENAYEDINTTWAGDVVGRVLLAYVSHYKITGKKNPSMDKIIDLLPERLNQKGYLHKILFPQINEQHLSGHSWFLRGLCEYYEQFGKEIALNTVKSVVENLYLPLLGRFKDYPIDRDKFGKEVSYGEIVDSYNGWILSSDIGCAFMSIDGLSHAYKLTKDQRIKDLLDEMIETYVKIDKIALSAQTHCTLTAGRGMITMFNQTGNQKYLQSAISIFNDYAYRGGVTYTYHNLNWWNKPETFSEPCAIVDSVMLATELYKITKQEEYRTFAARAYHNAFTLMQRHNGGAGTDTLVCQGSPLDYMGVALHYEAYWCCTMRIAEGFWYVYENKDLLYAQTNDKLVKNEHGIYMNGDLIYGEIADEFAHYAENPLQVDGKKLFPVPKFWKIPEKDAMKIKFKVVF